MIDPRTIPGAERIAHVSTGGHDLRQRWSEYSVWFLHDEAPRNRRWIAEIAGMTMVPGEYDRFTRFAAGTLARVLGYLSSESTYEMDVAETAREWADTHRSSIQNAGGKALSFADDTAALEWLYGAPDNARHTGFATMLARDTGAGESTIRMQLKRGRPVMVPLRALLPFIDRDAFRRARKGEDDRG